MKKLDYKTFNENFWPRIEKLNLKQSSKNFFVGKVFKLPENIVDLVLKELEKLPKHFVSKHFEYLFDLYLEGLMEKKPTIHENIKEPIYMESRLTFFKDKDKDKDKRIDIDQNISEKFENEETFNTKVSEEDFNLYTFKK